MSTVNESNVHLVKQLLTEYSQALRSTTANVNDRAVPVYAHVDMGMLAEALTTTKTLSLLAERYHLGLCPLGGGHWDDACASHGHVAWDA